MTAPNHSLAIIFGYLSKIDQLDSKAKKLGLKNRLGLAIDSVLDSSELLFDAKMFMPLIGAILSFFDKDHLILKYGDSEEKSFTSFTELDLFYVNRWKQDSEKSPFESIEAYVGGRPQCLVTLSPYAAVGGPKPYQDTFTYNFFFAPDIREIRVPMQSKILEYCVKKNIFLRDLLTGEVKPQNSFFSRSVR